MTVAEYVYKNRYSETIRNKQLQELLKQFADDTIVAIEYRNIGNMQYFPDRNLLVIS